MTPATRSGDGLASVLWSDPPRLSRSARSECLDGSPAGSASSSRASRVMDERVTADAARHASTDRAISTSFVAASTDRRASAELTGAGSYSARVLSGSSLRSSFPASAPTSGTDVTSAIRLAVIWPRAALPCARSKDGVDRVDAGMNGVPGSRAHCPFTQRVTGCGEELVSLVSELVCLDAVHRTLAGTRVDHQPGRRLDGTCPTVGKSSMPSRSIDFHSSRSNERFFHSEDESSRMLTGLPVNDSTPAAQRAQESLHSSTETDAGRTMTTSMSLSWSLSPRPSIHRDTPPQVQDRGREASGTCTRSNVSAAFGSTRARRSPRCGPPEREGPTAAH